MSGPVHTRAKEPVWLVGRAATNLEPRTRLVLTHLSEDVAGVALQGLYPRLSSPASAASSPVLETSDTRILTKGLDQRNYL